MSEWVGELTRSLSEEFGDQPLVCTLATVDKAGAPRARSVICRKVGTDGSLIITSDGRHEKNEQVKAVPQGEVVFWLPTRREQFRLFGSMKLISDARDPMRAEIWKH
jgi:pyridoxine/pyridoxamine 5'-phosphate oxidase